MSELTQAEKDVISKWSQFWGNDAEKIGKEWDMAKEKVAKLFPDSVSNTALFNQKVLQIVNGKLRNTGAGKVQKIKAVIFAVAAPHDMWVNQRNKTMAQFEALKNEGKEEEAMKLVVVDEKTGEIVPKIAKLKGDGKTISKKAGEKMPSPEDSLIQTIIGMTYEKKGDDCSPKGFVLTVNGPTCTRTFDNDTIYELEVTNRSSPGAEVLSLSTEKLQLVPSDDDFLKEGLKTRSRTDIVEKFFKNKILDIDTIYGWKEDGQVPKEWQYMEYIVKKVQVSNIRLEGSRKSGKASFFADVVPDINNPPTSEEKTSFYCGFEKYAVPIKFGDGSVVMIIGNGYIFKDKETGGNVFNFNLSGAIPYDGEYIPAIEAQEMTEADFIEPSKPKPAAVEKKVEQVEQQKITSDKDEDPWN